MALGQQGYTHLSALRLGGSPTLNQPPGADTLTGAGAINPDTLVTSVVTTGANAITLADGEVDGQIKVITMLTDGGDGTITPAHLLGGTTITVNDVGDSVILMWHQTTWRILSNFGCTVA